MSDDRPPGFPASGDPPTPSMHGSSIADEDFMILQRRAPLVEVPPPVVHQTQPTEGPTAAAPKKATKPKKPRKREREEGADADVDASPDAVDAAGEPKKRKKKKKLPDLDGAGKAAAVVQDPNGLDVTQVLSDIRNLPLAPFHGVDRRSRAERHSGGAAAGSMGCKRQAARTARPRWVVVRWPRRRSRRQHPGSVPHR